MKRLIAAFALITALIVAGFVAGALVPRFRTGAKRDPGAVESAPLRRTSATPTAEKEQAPVSIDLSDLLSSDRLRPKCKPFFVDVAESLGIEYTHVRGETGEHWLPEAQGGGVGWLDYDGDGWQDLYFAQGRQLPPWAPSREVNALYRNLRGKRFVRVPDYAAPSDPGYGMGVAVGDFDNDGFPDVYVANFGPDALYLNNGDGTFSRVDASAGVGLPVWSTSCAFADLDLDGDLDLYVATYIQFLPWIQCAKEDGTGKYCGPDYYEAEADAVYANDGRGFFWNMIEAAGCLAAEGKGLGVAIADLIGDDRLPEIFVANDLRPNFLFVNESTLEQTPSRIARCPDGPARKLWFTERGLALGCALNAEGVREANMGIACGDYDNDLDLDLYVTHYFMEHDTLWRNENNQYFVDVTRAAGLSVPTLQQLSWGTQFIDIDNDGWLDIFIASGHINDEGSDAVPFKMPPQLMFNAGAETNPVRFIEVTREAGPYFQQRYIGRASAMCDFDHDGRVDLAVLHHLAPSAVVQNRTQPVGNYICLEFVGTRSARDGTGVRVYVTCEGDPTRTLMRELVGGGSFQAADAHELLIGIGQAERVSKLTVRWPDGSLQTFGPLPANRRYRVYQGRDQLLLLPE